MDTQNLERDIISSLPDELLGYILSLVPTKEAASTTFLSKRWKNVFRLVQTLEFDESVAYPLSSERFRLDIFDKLVDRTLALQCDSPIKKLSLRYCRVRKKEDLACYCGWIRNVLVRGVQELELMLKPEARWFLPCLQVFRSKTLVKLTLGTNFYVEKLTQFDVCLPSLKILIIDLVKFFEFGDFQKLLLPGCPVLEELSVKHDWFTRELRFISSPTIKRLSLHGYGDNSIDVSAYMSFDTPNLIYLDYSDCTLRGYRNCDFRSLVEAKLDVMSSFRSDVTSFIMAIRNIQILHLSFQSVEEPDFQLLPDLVKQSPKLETLIITDLRGYTCDVSMHWNQVKVLHVLGYRGSDKELKQLENLLEKFEFLELVEVKVKYGDMILQTKRDLMMLPIVCSSNFNIQVSKQKKDNTMS